MIILKHALPCRQNYQRGYKELSIENIVLLLNTNLKRYHSHNKILFDTVPGVYCYRVIDTNRGPPGGYWIPISREKISHILKFRSEFSIFPIPNFHHRHPVKYFCSRPRTLFKIVIIEQVPKNCTRM